MREAGAPLTLIPRADVVPDIDGDDLGRVILDKVDLEAVGEGVRLDRDGRGGLRIDHSRGERERAGDE